MIAHNVYFTLIDKSPAAIEKLLADCRKYLAIHPGILYFGCGTLAEDHVRDVNVRDWDVGLHVVFQDKAAHDYYHDHQAHQEFVAENEANWKTARVFDSWLA